MRQRLQCSHLAARPGPLDLAFHLAIVRAAGNPLVQMMFQRHPALHRRAPASQSDRCQRHPARAWCFTGGSPGRSVRARALAAAEMGEHLTIGIELFGADIDRNLNLVARDALAPVRAAVTFEDVMRLSQEPGWRLGLSVEGAARRTAEGTGVDAPTRHPERLWVQDGGADRQNPG